MGKVVLYSAISADGLIAGPHDETPWSNEEWRAFQKFVTSCDVCLLGHTTYGIMRDGHEFVDGTRYVVATSDAHADTGKYEKVSIRNPRDMPDAGMVGIIGGGELNGSLAELGVLDELILDVESVVLGQGTQLFGSHSPKCTLELISSKKIGSSTIQNHYKVVNS